MTGTQKTETKIKSGYETTYIARPDMAESALKALQEKLESVVAEYQGELILSEDWGTKRMMYKIQKESRGRYSYFVYTGVGNVVAEIERHLRMNDHIIRFLSVNIAKEFNKEAFLKRREEMKAQAKRREEEREARRAEREANRKKQEAERHHGSSSHRSVGSNAQMNEFSVDDSDLGKE